MNNNKNTAHPLDEDQETNVTQRERNLLDESIENSITHDHDNLRRAELDHTDEEGTPLNEKSSYDDVSGKDLDIPGEELDDNNEEIGEEDEENNGYSKADTE